MTTMLTGTREYVERIITASVDLVTQQVQFSFDRGVTFNTGTWDTTASTVTTEEIEGIEVTRYTRVARILVGDVDVPLPDPGEHAVWIKIPDSPEIPIIPAGSLVVLPA